METTESILSDELEEVQKQDFLSESYLSDLIRRIDEKIIEIEATVKRLFEEEAEIQARRSDRVSGDVDAIVSKTRQAQMRLQELRDTIEIEQAPLSELKARRAELLRQYDTLKRLKTHERVKHILEMVESLKKQLSSIKERLEALDTFST